MTATHPDSAQVNQLAAAARVTEGIVGGVRPDQASDLTPCPGLDLAQLRDHLVGFAQNFADRAEGISPPTDPRTVEAGADPPAAYRVQAGRLVSAYGGQGPSPGAVPLGIALIETIVHGWDLAIATGQPTPYPGEAVAAALAGAKGMMSPDFRGPDKSFDVEVPVPIDASVLDRLVGFMGRDPGWKAPP